MGDTTRYVSAQALEDSQAFAWDAPTVLQAITTHPAVSLNVVRGNAMPGGAAAKLRGVGANGGPPGGHKKGVSLPLGDRHPAVKRSLPGHIRMPPSSGVVPRHIGAYRCA